MTYQNVDGLEIVVLREKIKQLEAENARLKGMVDEIQAARHVNREHDKLLVENARLRAALDDAATSLETIAIRSHGEESYLDSKPQMRAFAQARADVVRKDLALKEKV